MKQIIFSFLLILSMQLHAQWEVPIDDIFQFNSGAEYKEISSPTTPPSGYGIVYAKTDNHLYFKNDAGTEYDLLAYLIGGGTLLSLSDFPDAYTSQADKLIKVKHDESGVEFYSIAPGALLMGNPDDGSPYYDENLNWDPIDENQLNIIENSLKVVDGDGFYTKITGPFTMCGDGSNLGSYGPNYIQLTSALGGTVIISKGDGVTNWNFKLPIAAPEEGQTFVYGADDQWVFNDVLGGSVPLDRMLTINGVGYDLAADRSWTVGDTRNSNNLSDLANAATARTNLGLGTAAVQNISAFLQPSNNLSDVTTPATARTNLGLGTIALLNAIEETHLSFTDITTANTSTSKHGLVPKLPNDATKFFDGVGNYTVPVAGRIGACAGGNAVTATTTLYAPFEGQTNFNSTEAARQYIMPYAGTIKNFYVRTGTSQPNSGTFVFTIRKNGSATAVTLTVASNAAAGTFSDVTHSFTFSAGDLISVEAVNNASGGSANVISWSAQVTQ